MSPKGSKSSQRAVGPKSSAASSGSGHTRGSNSSKPWLFAIILVVATLLAYSNCFSSPFVLDDDDAIVTNPTIRTLSPISRSLSGPPQSSTAGRPIVNLSFALNYAAGGLNPDGYHVVNLVIHILCGLLVFGVVRRTLSSLSSESSRLEPSNLSNISNLSALFRRPAVAPSSVGDGGRRLRDAADRVADGPGVS